MISDYCKYSATFYKESEISQPDINRTKYLVMKLTKTVELSFLLHLNVESFWMLKL